MSERERETKREREKENSCWFNSFIACATAIITCLYLFMCIDCFENVRYKYV